MNPKSFSYLGQQNHCSPVLYIIIMLILIIRLNLHAGLDENLSCEGEICILKDLERGVCSRRSSCSLIEEITLDGSSPFICNYEENADLICCPVRSIQHGRKTVGKSKFSTIASLHSGIKPELGNIADLEKKQIETSYPSEGGRKKHSISWAHPKINENSEKDNEYINRDEQSRFNIDKKDSEREDKKLVRVAPTIITRAADSFENRGPTRNQKHVVGPDYDLESSILQAYDPQNPFNQHDIHKPLLLYKLSTTPRYQEAKTTLRPDHYNPNYHAMSSHEELYPLSHLQVRPTSTDYNQYKPTHQERPIASSREHSNSTAMEIIQPLYHFNPTSSEYYQSKPIRPTAFVENNRKPSHQSRPPDFDEYQPRPTHQSKPTKYEQSQPRPTHQSRPTEQEQYQTRPTYQSRPTKYEQSQSRPTHQSRPTEHEQYQPRPTHQSRPTNYEQSQPRPTHPSKPAEYEHQPRPTHHSRPIEHESRPTTTNNKPKPNDNYNKPVSIEDTYSRPSSEYNPSSSHEFHKPGRPKPTQENIFFPSTQRPGHVTQGHHSRPDGNQKTSTSRPQRRPVERSISERKCKEYAKKTMETIAGLPLTVDPTPVKIQIQKCRHNAQQLIVGGENATVGEFPHMAVLGFYNSRSGEIEWNCGGTLISDRYVLTAAHCRGSKLGKPAVVRLGELNIASDRDGAQPVDYQVEDMIIHPEYKSSAHYHDIALLRLARSVPITRNVQPACLYSKPNFTVSKAVATGWGRTQYASETSDMLLKVVLNIVDNNKCNRLYKAESSTLVLSKGIVSSQMCAGDLNGRKDTCQGDSGGPIEITTHGNQCLHHVIGVTSFGKRCGLPNAPGVYTRVSSYIPWIEGIVWPEEIRRQERPHN